MALEAGSGFVRRFDAQPGSHALGTVRQQGLVGAGVGIMSVPDDELVLKNDRVLPGLDRAVACGCRAGLDAEVNGLIVLCKRALRCQRKTE